MKTRIIAIGMALSLAFSASAMAQSANLSGDNTNNTTSAATSNSGNQGVNNTNNFESSADTTEHVHYSGVTGSNQSIGLSGYAGSFSPNYCGGTAQAGVSVPYVTIAAGKPVLGEPGVACVTTVASVHTMEYAATFGNAAAKAMASANDYDRLAHPTSTVVNENGKVRMIPASAIGYADAQRWEHMAVQARQAAETDAAMSQKLAQAAVNMQCTISETVRKALRDAGVFCPQTDEEKAAAAKQQQAVRQQQAVASNEPTDEIVRRRLGLAPLPK